MQVEIYSFLPIRLSQALQMWNRVKTLYIKIETGCLKQSVLTYESSEI